MNLRIQLAAAAILLFLSCLASAQSDSKHSEKDRQEQRRSEEALDYYKKWLDEDVVYIITPEERGVFDKLTTPVERERFIEQFWVRRDPSPRTPLNETKEEHYGRIAYANKWFTEAVPGWRTDRGRIYIIHGEPDERETHEGGPYTRLPHEGGGTTSTFPFERWWYRHIPGMGGDVELEFVDPSFSGQFRLSMDPEEKDAFLHLPGAGLNFYEEMGVVGKKDRPFFNPANRFLYPYGTHRRKDNPFLRYETYAMVQAPPDIRYQDLKRVVTVGITYDDLPFRVRQDSFSLNEERVIVPITVELENKDLSYTHDQANDRYLATAGVYGVITSMTKGLIEEFEDEIVSTFATPALQRGQEKRSLYQKMVVLERRGRYKLEVVVKDLTSGTVGVERRVIVPPKYDGERLAVSSLVLAERVNPLEGIPTKDEMFVLGDVKVIPNPGRSFQEKQPIGVYLQVYNAALDQTSLKPSLRLSCELTKNGKLVTRADDDSGQSLQYFSSDRAVVILRLPGLDAGKYGIRLTVKDQIRDQVVTTEDDFQVVSLTKLAETRSSSP